MMEIKDFRRAEKLRVERQRLVENLRVWKEILTEPNRLGYRERKDKYIPLNVTIPDSIFNQLRTTMLQGIREEITKLDTEFTNL